MIVLRSEKFPLKILILYKQLLCRLLKKLQNFRSRSSLMAICEFLQIYIISNLILAFTL